MSRPNILILLTDQQRYDALGCDGAAVCRTPAADALATGGMRFSSAYTPIALCSPARGSLLTGLYPHNHGQLANIGNFNSVFDSNVVSHTGYFRLLHDAGYRTAYFGKWHLPRTADGEFWGIDAWHTRAQWLEDLRTAGIDFDYGRDEVQRLEWGGSAPFCGTGVLAAEDMCEAWCVDRCTELLHDWNDQGEPFAMCIGFRGPHFPYAVPVPYDTMYSPEQVPRWSNFEERFQDKPSIQEKEMRRWNTGHLTWPDWQRVIAHYWGYCRFIDDQIARLLTRLDDLSLTRDTLVIFTSDHGDMLGSHRLFNKGFNAYEEDHHIPLVVRWPEEIEPGGVSDRFVNLTDLMPTVLDAAGVPVPEGLDGRSLLPLLRGQDPEDWPDTAYAEFHGYESTLYSMRMIRTAEWKYVYNPAAVDELYDLESDPGELSNLAGSPGYDHVLRRMKLRLVDRLRACGDSIVAEGSWQSNSYDLYLSGREE